MPSCSICPVSQSERDVIEAVANLHLRAFPEFFLTTLGAGFLRQMYASYCGHEESALLVAKKNDVVLGFAAYSLDMSSLYRYMIRNRLFLFAYYALGAVLAKPSIVPRLLGAFSRSEESRRTEPYAELASLGVCPQEKGRGIGTALVNEVKERVARSGCSYISLETDADDNDKVNNFYLRNGFMLARVYTTKEGRRMNEYHYPNE